MEQERLSRRAQTNQTVEPLRPMLFSGTASKQATTKPRICLVGGSGFIGSHLLQRLANDYDLVVLSRNPSAKRAHWVLPNATFRRVDVYDADQLRHEFSGASAVINLVGVLQDAGSDGVGFHQAHVTLVDRIIEACTKVEGTTPRLIHISALNAGEGESHYLKTKGEAEALIRAQNKVPWTLLQPSVIFGPGDSFLNRFASLLKISPVMPQPCPQAKIQPVYIGDVVDAVARCLADDHTVGQTFSLVGPRTYTLIELIDFVREQLGLKRWVIGLPDGVSRLMATVFNLLPAGLRPFSKDNYLSLQTDSVSADNALPRLGIRPTPMELVVPKYLAPRDTSPVKAQRYQRFREHARR